MLFFHGWDLFRPKNPFKVPCDAVVGTYLGPEILLRYHLALELCCISVVGTYLGPKILLRYHDGLDLANFAAEFFCLYF